MVKKILLLLCLSLSCVSHAQELTIHVNSKGKVGFVDKNGTEVIKCQYDAAYPFQHGVSIVSKSGKSGMIDSTGTVVLPLKYSSISIWTDSLHVIQNGKVQGLVDLSGKIILEAKYSLISKPNCYGKALIAVGGTETQDDKKKYMSNAKYGIIDRKGTILVPPTNKGLYEFSYVADNVYPYNGGRRLYYSYHYTSDTLVTDCSYLGFNNNGFNILDCGIMDGNGKILLDKNLYDIVMIPKSGMVRYYIRKKKETLCGYHNLETGTSFQAASFAKPSDEINFWTHSDFTNEIAAVNGTSWSFINKTGQVVREGYIEIKYSEYCGLWAALNAKGKWEVFDDSNHTADSLTGYDGIGFPRREGDEKVYVVQKGDLYGGIAIDGSVKIPFEYQLMSQNNYDVVPSKKNGKWGAVSTIGSEIIPHEFADIVLPSERGAKHFWVQKDDSLYYHFNVETKQVSPKAYSAVTNFKDGVALVVPVGFKLDSTVVNVAQVYEPNASYKELSEVQLQKHAKAFGVLINTDDEYVMDLPVSTMYKDAVVKAIKEVGDKSLTESKKKAIMLEVTESNRSYNLKSTLSEDEWNY